MVVAMAQKQTETLPSVKDLASSDASARRKNLQSILGHLETRSPQNCLTHTQALQLWRGFHVSLYMHDSKNQLSVQTLIATLAATFEIVRWKDAILQQSKSASATENLHSNGTSTNEGGDEAEADDFQGFNDEPNTVTAEDDKSNNENSWLTVYTTAFWETIAREWSAIDQWRMNKYLLLIRFTLRTIFTICLRSYFGLEQDDSAATEVEAEAEIDTEATGGKKRKRTNAAAAAVAASPEAKTPKSKKAKTASTTSAPPSTSTLKDKNPTTSQLALLTTHPLSPRSRKITDGLRLHVLDIYTDELLHAFTSIKPELLAQSDNQYNEVETLLRDTFLQPVHEIAKDGLARVVRVKAKELLSEWEGRWKDAVGANEN